MTREKPNNWIFPTQGKVPTGESIAPGSEEIKKGLVEGPWMLNYTRGRYPIVDALADPLAAIGIKAPKRQITEAPRASTYSGKFAYNGTGSVGDVAYRMIKNEIEADGYNVIEVSAAELERISPSYKSPFGAEDSDVGGKNIYVVKSHSSEKKTEVAYHEWRAKKLVETKGGNHADYHSIVEREQGPATQDYLRRAMRALMN